MWTNSRTAALCMAAIVMAATITECTYWHYETDKLINQDYNIEEKQEIEDIKIETEINKESDKNKAIEPINLGEFKLTAYCSCSKCCGEFAYNRPLDKNGKEIVYGAIGERLIANYSIAVDPEVIPYNSKVIINEKIYEAQDCGGAIQGNRIDLYFEDHEEALEFGIQYAEVFLMPYSDSESY